MSDYKAVEQIEGPYWDFSARNSYLHDYRYAHANNAAEYLLAGDVDWALRFAAKWAELSAALERSSERYNATKDLDIKWIGWRSSWK